MAEQSKAERERQRAAQAGMTAAQAQAREKRALASAEYEEATQGLGFSKEFHTHNAAVMRDVLEAAGPRFLAWLRRNAWGEYSLFAIGPDGEPLTQADAARDLGISKSRISHVVAYYEARGLVECKGKVLYPVISPGLFPPPEKVADSRNFSKFLEHWKVAHSSDFHELEVARSTVKRIRKVLLSHYKAYRKQETNAGASLLETARPLPDPEAELRSCSPLEESNRRHEETEKAAAQAAEEQPKNPPEKGGEQSKGQRARAMRKLLFEEIARMQRAHPTSEFSRIPIDPKNPDHDKLVTLILAKLGGAWREERVIGWLMWVAAKFKGLGGTPHERKKRAPGMAGGPETLGLLVVWAEDYARIDRGEAAGAS